MILLFIVATVFAAVAVLLAFLAEGDNVGSALMVGALAGCATLLLIVGVS